jgi:predicted ArsR family transcriptional regulator
MLDFRDEMILETLFHNGALGFNQLHKKTEIPKATLYRHLPDLQAKNLIKSDKVPYKKRKSNSSRPFYSIKLNITKKGINTLASSKAEQLENLKIFFEHPDVSHAIWDKFINEWIKDAAMEQGYNEDKMKE